MPKITSERTYDGASERVRRLGLAPLLDQVRGLLTGFTLLVKEERDANGRCLEARGRSKGRGPSLGRDCSGT